MALTLKQEDTKCRLYLKSQHLPVLYLFPIPERSVYYYCVFHASIHQ